MTDIAPSESKGAFPGDHLQIILDNMLDMICQVDIDGTYQYLSPSYKTVLGYLPEELVGRSAFEFSHPGDTNRVVEVFKSAISNRAPGKVEYRYRHKNGHYMWLESIGKPLLTDCGAVIGAIISTRDIAERKRAEEAMQDSEEKYRLVVENANEAIVIAQEGVIEFANQASSRIIGRNPEDIVSHPFTEFIYPPDREMVVERYKRRLAGEQIEDLYAFRVVTGNGNIRWVEISAVCIEWQGHPATLNFLSNITERKKIEDDLRRSREKYHNIFQNSILGLYQSIPEGKYISVNPAFARLFGYRSPEEMLAYVNDIGHQLYVSNHDRERAIKLINEQGFLEGFELEVRRRDGTKFWISMNTLIVQDEDGTHFDGTVEDITKRKQAEETRDLLVKKLESKNVEMERFIYTVSHDLRSPLVTISGFTDFLRSDMRKGDLESADADLDVINSTVAKMDLLLSDTLELSRIGRIASPPDIVSFEDMAKEVLGQLRGQIKEKEVEVKVDSGLPSVYVDRMRIAEVLINLIENSMKYMGDQPSPRIEIGYRQNDGAFFVKDNGIGVDPSQHDRVFELFYKIDTKSEGTGAGLAIVKRIIEVHGGRVWIESEPGEGCTVCFILPMSRDMVPN